MIILGVDPGSSRTAYALVHFDPKARKFRLLSHALDENASKLTAESTGHVIRAILRQVNPLWLVVEEAAAKEGKPGTDLPLDCIVVEKQWIAGNKVSETAAAAYGLLARRPVVAATAMRVKKFFGMHKSNHSANKRAALRYVQSTLGYSRIGDHNIADAVLLCVYAGCRFTEQIELCSRVSAVFDDCKVDAGTPFERSLYTFEVGEAVDAGLDVSVFRHDHHDAAKPPSGSGGDSASHKGKEGLRDESQDLIRVES